MDVAFILRKILTWLLCATLRRCTPLIWRFLVLTMGALGLGTGSAPPVPGWAET